MVLALPKLTIFFYNMISIDFGILTYLFKELFSLSSEIGLSFNRKLKLYIKALSEIELVIRKARNDVKGLEFVLPIIKQCLLSLKINPNAFGRLLFFYLFEVEIFLWWIWEGVLDRISFRYRSLQTFFKDIIALLQRNLG